MNKDTVVSMWRERFGISEDVFKGFGFFRRGRMIWAFSLPEIPPFRCESIGMRVISMRESPWKPTTYALQLWGRHARKNVIDLNDEMARRFFAGESLELRAQVERGYVVVTHMGSVIGCGLYTPGKLISQLPRERRILDDQNAPEHHAQPGDTQQDGTE
ncbi:MAG TPA: hypothetical protein PK659_03185 [Methanothrix sp.]|nr:hypothetical protein [Methanothrix sp.]HOK57761.1 hypothetical protein [Methanothrix sp.]HOL43245.1 hypothetical protein [Methanothrix sp.]HPO88345.1 hypothetical protein [Methanothrix sp.]